MSEKECDVETGFVNDGAGNGKDDAGATLIAHVKIEEFSEAKVLVIGVDVLEPSVHELMQAERTMSVTHVDNQFLHVLIAVVLASAAGRLGSSSCFTLNDHEILTH